MGLLYSTYLFVGVCFPLFKDFLETVLLPEHRFKTETEFW